MEEKRGLFVTFEGGEGCGKSTQVKLVGNYLSQLGYKVKVLREPGGTPIGEELRHTLKHSKDNDAMTPEAELLLMNSSRSQLVNQIIIPALSNGEIVICDRFYDSTTAYQGYGRQLDLKAVQTVVDLATRGLKPDLTFLLNASPEEGRVNIEKRMSGLPFIRDRIEESDENFFKRIQNGYQTIAAQEPERVKIIPYRSNGIDVNHGEIIAYIGSFIKDRPNMYLAKK